MFKTLAAAGLLIGLCGTASAAPAAPSAIGIQAEAPAFTLVAKRGHKGRHHWRGNHHRNHWRGRHHRRHWRGPPPGWRRYHSRPWGWQRRGCVMFGPVWFCP